MRRTTTVPPVGRSDGAGERGPALSRGLTMRHIQFIALGSAIGTGLFYGFATAIQKAGPAVILAHLLAGAAVYMVMRALGEMAVRHPVPGSFGQYAVRYLGPFAGFVTGWTFVFEMIVVAISAINADTSGAGRMLFGLAEHGQAPWAFTRVSRNGVPWLTVVVMSIALGIGAVLNAVIPEDVFLISASIATFATVWVWLMIVLLGWFPDTRVALIVGVVWLVLLGVGYALFVRGGGRHRPPLDDHTALITLPRS